MDIMNTAPNSVEMSRSGKAGGESGGASMSTSTGPGSGFHGMAHGAGGGYGSAGAMAVMNDGDNSVSVASGGIV